MTFFRDHEKKLNLSLGQLQVLQRVFCEKKKKTRDKQNLKKAVMKWNWSRFKNIKSQNKKSLNSRGKNISSISFAIIAKLLLIQSAVANSLSKGALIFLL